MVEAEIATPARLPGDPRKTHQWWCCSSRLPRRWGRPFLPNREGEEERQRPKVRKVGFGESRVGKHDFGDIDPATIVVFSLGDVVGAEDVDGTPKLVESLSGKGVLEMAVYPSYGWHFMARTYTGDVWAWGQNGHRQCGTDSKKKHIKK